MLQEVVASRCQPPENRPERAKGTVESLGPGELFFFQNHMEISRGQQRLRLGSRVVQSFASFEHRPAHDFRRGLVASVLRFGRPILGGQIAKVILVELGSAFLPQFIRGEERIQNPGQGFARNRIGRPVGKGFETLLHKVGEDGPFRTR